MIRSNEPTCQIAMQFIYASRVGMNLRRCRSAILRCRARLRAVT